MSADYSNIQTQPQTRNGLAVASLVLGIISIPTLGLLGVGAITALVLAAIALKRINKEPAIYGGKGVAIAGIITSVVSLLLIAVFLFSSSSVSNETFCIHAVRASDSVARRDFVICENGIIRFVESRTPSLVNRGEGAELGASYYSR